MSDQKKYLEASRRELEEAALNYARIEANGCYVENGKIVSLCYSDRQRMATYFTNQMQLAAKNILIEMTLLPMPERLKDKVQP